MLQAGVAIPSAMQTTTEAVSNIVYREQLDIARQQMLEGAGFTQPLIETELFPGAARQMFKVGEETGTLDQQLEVAAEYFNRELEYRIKTFTTLFEPIMIIFVGVVVGFVGDRARVGDVRRARWRPGTERRVISRARSDRRTPGRRRSPAPCRRPGTGRTAAPSCDRPCWSPSSPRRPRRRSGSRRTDPTGTIAGLR